MIVFDRFDECGSFTSSLEVDDTIHSLVSATYVTASDVALIISSASFLERNE
jgi:hypothetical protein